MQRPEAAAGDSEPLARFELAPPRHFLLPTILLLLLEEPTHGYSLVKELRSLRLGRVDRPSVYRALAQLEADGLVVDMSPDEPSSAQPKRVYGLTPRGERALRAWMGVIKEERDGLDRVLHRYATSGSLDAVLAAVGEGWAVAAGLGPSLVSPTSETDRRRDPTSLPPLLHSLHDADPAASDGATPPAKKGKPMRGRFDIVPERSAVLIEARSSVGPITFGAVGVRGVAESDVVDGSLSANGRSSAHVEIDVTDLASGNALYDAELLRRIDARRFPTVTLELLDSAMSPVPDRIRLAGEVTVHGVTRELEGTIAFSLTPEGRLVVTGEQVFDIRDFDIASPSVLMLRIYPDVRVHLHVEAELSREKSAGP